MLSAADVQNCAWQGKWVTLSELFYNRLVFFTVARRKSEGCCTLETIVGRHTLFLLSFGDVNFSLRFGKNVLKAIFLKQGGAGKL
jgi:hypothetical protein